MSVYKTLSARERILNTAHTLFYREGIRATGVDRLIAEQDQPDPSVPAVSTSAVDDLVAQSHRTETGISSG